MRNYNFLDGSQKGFSRWWVTRIPLSLLFLGLGGVSASGKNLKHDIDYLADRLGQDLVSYSGTPPQHVMDRSAELVGKPLTVKTAVELALLRNRNIQVLLAELGISRTKHIGDSLPSNPELELGWTGGDSQGLSEFRVLQDVNDVLLFPLKRGRASDRMRRDRYALAHELLVEITDIKKAFFELQGSKRMNDLLSKQLSSTEIAAELVRRQKKAGNINTLELSVHEADVANIRLSYARSNSEFLMAREQFERRLGINGDEWDWEIVPSPPDIPSTDPDLGTALELAEKGRMDLAAAHAGHRAANKDLSLARWKLIPHIQVGALVEKDDGDQRIGPAVEVEIPLFDWGFSRVKKSRYFRSQSLHNVSALEAMVQLDVREALMRMTESRNRAAALAKEIIPARKVIVRESQKHYNYMLIGVYDLLRAKREEAAARTDHVEAVRDYWVARSDLEQAVGGHLPVVKNFEANIQSDSQEPDEEENEDRGEHHHDHE